MNTTADQRTEHLLDVGAVLPLNTPDPGGDAVPMEVRAYHHPALGERVVARLITTPLRVAEDAAAGFLGMSPQGDPIPVGLGKSQELGFPEWVLVHYPEDGHHALDLVPEIDRAAQRIATKPMKALDAFKSMAQQLAAAVPHFLPTFFEHAGRLFLAGDNTTYAAQMFSRARKAEEEFGLSVDEDRVDAVFLEFALAGALPANQLQTYARTLSAQVPAPDALARYRRLAIRRTQAGLTPSTTITTSLRTLARKAGQDPTAVEASYLVEILALPATRRVPMRWWTAHRAALAIAIAEHPFVRGELLNVEFPGHDLTLEDFIAWLELLEDLGAVDGLIDPTLPAEVQPRDGAIGWLERFMRMRWNQVADHYIPTLHDLVERMADRLRTESAIKPFQIFHRINDITLHDLLLSLGVAVTAPPNDYRWGILGWSTGSPRRDLQALCADGRFTDALMRTLDELSLDDDDRYALELLADTEATAPLVREWVRGIAQRSQAGSVVELAKALATLDRLPGDVLRLARQEVEAATRQDVAELLARTLRAGIFDELGWPAWDAAVAELVPQGRDLLIADAWPYLIVAGNHRARVLGADGPVLSHDLRYPPGESIQSKGFTYVDGELLVTWVDAGRLRGYWQGRSGGPHTLDGPIASRSQVMYFMREGSYGDGLPLPGGGWTTGTGVLRAGDVTIPRERKIMGDGASWWTLTRADNSADTWTWVEYDPLTGQTGRASLPGPVSDALHRYSARIEDTRWWIAPRGGSGAQPGSSADAVGWISTQRPDGSWIGIDLAGRLVKLPKGVGRPVALLTFPGIEHPVAVVASGWLVTMVNADGTSRGDLNTDDTPGDFAAGTALLPPHRYWHYLRPRDLPGSAALRRIDNERANALITVVAEASTRTRNYHGAVAAVLPEVTDPALQAGIATITRIVAEERAKLAQTAQRLAEHLAAPSQPRAVSGPSNAELASALSGLTGGHGSWWIRRFSEEPRAIATLQKIAHGATALSAPTAEGESSGPGHAPTRVRLPGNELPWDLLIADVPALALRSAAATTSAEHRRSLHAVLDELAHVERVAPHGTWHLVTLAASHLSSAAAHDDGNCLYSTSDTLLAVGSPTEGDNQYRYPALAYTVAKEPVISIPSRIIRDQEVVSTRPTGWVQAFLAEIEARGPAPWQPQAAEEFAALTGVSLTLARLIVAGMPQVDTTERDFLTSEERALLGVGLAAVVAARDELKRVPAEARRSVVAALLPADPTALWTTGPDVAAAATVWNDRVGQRIPLPDDLLADASKALKLPSWDATSAVRAVLSPANEPELTVDREFVLERDRFRAAEDTTGFTGTTLTALSSTLLWLAYRLPAGSSARAVLPATLALLRERLAHPGLLVSLNDYVRIEAFQKVAGAPTERRQGFDRYGAVLMPTHDTRPMPAIRIADLDSSGSDPYLTALEAIEHPFPIAALCGLVRSDALTDLVADPGDPAAGDRDPDGIWWPQDPARSVPDLVAEAAQRFALTDDAAALYLMILALPDPSDRAVKRWTGWRPARYKAAVESLADTPLVVRASRARAGRTLFLPGGWVERHSPALPIEAWKLNRLADGLSTTSPFVPVEPVPALFRRAWSHVTADNGPQFDELISPRASRGRR